MAIPAGIIAYIVNMYIIRLVPGPGAAPLALVDAVSVFILVAVIVPTGGLIFYKRGAAIGQVLAAVIVGPSLAWQMAHAVVETLILGPG